MDPNLQSKVTTLLTGCNGECQKSKEMSKLKVEYQDYLWKYIQSYSKYMVLRYGQTLEDKQFQREYEKKSREFNQKMEYIENILNSDIEEANRIIREQKQYIENKNRLLDQSRQEIYQRKKILNKLTKNLVTDKGQIHNFDDKLLKSISIFPYIPLLKNITVNYDKSTYYLLFINILVFLVIIFFILKILI